MAASNPARSTSTSGSPPASARACVASGCGGSGRNAVSAGNSDNAARVTSGSPAHTMVVVTSARPRCCNVSRTAAHAGANNALSGAGMSHATRGDAPPVRTGHSDGNSNGSAAHIAAWVAASSCANAGSEGCTATMIRRSASISPRCQVRVRSASISEFGRSANASVTTSARRTDGSSAARGTSSATRSFRIASRGALSSARASAGAYAGSSESSGCAPRSFANASVAAESPIAAAAALRDACARVSPGAIASASAAATRAPAKSPRDSRASANASRAATNRRSTLAASRQD